MPKVNFPVVGTFARVKQRGITPESTINMYLINQGNEKVPDTLINVPGFISLENTPYFPFGEVGRMLYVDDQQTIYAVVSEYVYKLTTTFEPILLGTLTTDTGYVDIEGNNSDQIMFVDGANGYIYNITTNTFGRITDPDILPSPQSVAFLDGRFIINSAGTNQWQISDLNDGTSWDALNIQELETQKDTIQAIAVNQRIIFLFGNQVTECWNDVGNPDFPFARLDTMNFQVGAASTASVTQAEGLLFWLGRSTNGTASVMLSDGGMPIAVSTVDVDQEINNYALTTDCETYYFRENGYTFLAVNFTTEDQSWLYNVTNRTWTKQSTHEGNRHRIKTIINYGELNYALSYDDADFYEVSQAYNTFDGDPIVKERITHRFFDQTLRDIKVSYIEIDCLHGFAPQAGSPENPNYSADPFLELSVSKDAGITFGPNVRAPIGRVGKRGVKTYWHNLGINKDFVFRFRCYANVDFYLRDMSILYSLAGPQGRS
jgi:hypothetical protein